MEGISRGPHSILIQGPDAIAMLRLMYMVKGLLLEARTGMRLTRKAPSCYSLAKNEFGLKGNKEKVLAQLVEIVRQKLRENNASEDDLNALLDAATTQS
jgi:hypothetical protein